MDDTDIVAWLRQEADDWEPDDETYEEGYRSPTAERLREAATDIERLRTALSLIGAGKDWAADVARAALLGEDVTAPNEISPSRTTEKDT